MSSSINVNVLCIPRVFANISEERVRHIFGELNIGTLGQVDMVSKMDAKGVKFARVFVHLDSWNNSENATISRERLMQGKEIKIIYDDPWFWKVSAYRQIEHQSVMPDVRIKQTKATIKFDSDEDIAPRHAPIKQDYIQHNYRQQQATRQHDYRQNDYIQNDYRQHDYRQHDYRQHDYRQNDYRQQQEPRQQDYRQEPIKQDYRQEPRENQKQEPRENQKQDLKQDPKQFVPRQVQNNIKKQKLIVVEQKSIVNKQKSMVDDEQKSIVDEKNIELVIKDNTKTNTIYVKPNQTVIEEPTAINYGIIKFPGKKKSANTKLKLINVKKEIEEGEIKKGDN